MATYTDLQNKVKETLNVGYKDRITTQPVKFYNEQNEYWGSFKGVMNVENISVESGTLKNVNLYDSNLCGNVKLPGGVDIAKIGTDITELKEEVNDINDSKIPNLIQKLTDETTNRKIADAELKNIIDYGQKSISDELSALNEKLTQQDSDISTILNAKINLETENRVAADAVLQSNINANTALINSESIARKAEDDLLYSTINQLDLKTFNADTALCNRIKQHEIDVEIALNTEHQQMLSTVLHDKHYELYGLNGELQQSYPHELKEFAVNVLKTSINDGLVKNSKNVTIGTYNKKQDGTVVFKVNNPLLDPEIRNIALVEGSVLEFTESQKWCYTGCPAINSYKIVLNDDDPEHLVFNLSQRTDAYYSLKYNGDYIGTIRDYLLDEDQPEVSFISGKITVNATGIPEIEGFNCSGLKFTREEPLINVPGTLNQILFNTDNYKSFKFRRDVHTIKYTPIYSNDLEPVEFGQILFGNIDYSETTIESIKFNLLSPFENDVILNNANNFYNIFKPDYILSAQLNGLSASFELINRHAYFKYNVHLSDDTTFEKSRVATIVVGQENTELSDKNYSVISVSLEDLEIAQKFKEHDWKLSKTIEEGGLIHWYCHEVLIEEAINKSWITLDFNGLYLDVNTWNSDNGTAAYRHYLVKQTKIGYANQNALTTVHKSNLIDITKFPVTKTVPTYTYDITELEYHGESTQNPFQLTIDQTQGKKLCLTIPNKQWNNISREFLLTLNIISTETSLSEYKCEFNYPIKIFNDKLTTLSIKPGIWTTYQFNEIKQNTFLVTDLNDNKEYTVLSVLSSKLDDEIYLRNSQYQQLSDAISTNISAIDDLYKQIQGGLVYRDKLSIDINIQDDRDKGHLSGLFSQNIQNVFGVDRTASMAFKLRNGFYYIAYSEDKINPKYFDNSEIKYGDLIIIKNNTVVSDLIPDKVTIIDIMDKDAVHEERLCQVSNWLSSDYHTQIVNLSTSLSNTVKLSVHDLCCQIISNDNDISYLSTTIDNICSDVSNYIDYLSDYVSGFISTTISTNIDNIANISNDIYKNVHSGNLLERGLSGKVEFLLSVDRETMNYKGTLPYLPNLSSQDEPTKGKDLGYNHLSNLVSAYAVDGNLKLGDFFKLSAQQSCLVDVWNNVSVWFSPNDFFVINRNCTLDDLRYTDIDIFRNAEEEVKELSIEFDQKIKNLSSNLSNTIKVHTLSSTEVSSIEDIANSYSISWNNDDIIIVKKRFGESNETISSLYEHTAYVYDGTNWKAMDGNYSANNVYLKDDFMLAGDYTLGNVKPYTTTLYTISAGTSVADTLTEIFTLEKEPTTLIGGSITTTIIYPTTTNPSDQEVGTYVKPQYKVVFNSGNFSYGSVTDNGIWTSGTGITCTKLTLHNSTDTTKINASSGTTYTASTAIQFKETANYYSVTGTGSWSASNTPALNTHKPSKTKSKLPAYTDQINVKYLIQGYRCMFAGSFTTKQTINSDTIRKLTKVKAQKCSGETLKVGTGIFNATIVENAIQVLIAVPISYSVANVYDKGAIGTDIFDQFKSPVTINVNGNNNYSSISYNVYEYVPLAALGSNEYGITVA